MFNHAFSYIVSYLTFTDPSVGVLSSAITFFSRPASQGENKATVFAVVPSDFIQHADVNLMCTQF